MDNRLLVATALVWMSLMAPAAAPLFGQNVETGPPGRLVDIGGRRLHLHCRGAGSPTVLFEAGGGGLAIRPQVVVQAVEDVLEALRTAARLPNR